jgi:hypothetical protein
VQRGQVQRGQWATFIKIIVINIMIINIMLHLFMKNKQMIINIMIHLFMKIILKQIDNTNGFHLSQTLGRSAIGKRHT